MDQVLDGSTVIHRNPRVVHRSLGQEDGAVLLHLDTALYYGINRVGAVVWDLLEDDITFQHLLGELRHRIDEVPSVLEEDIAAFLRELQRRDMVTFESQ
jgi:hypothetical protein